MMNSFDGPVLCMFRSSIVKWLRRAEVARAPTLFPAEFLDFLNDEITRTCRAMSEMRKCDFFVWKIEKCDWDGVGEKKRATLDGATTSLYY
jgi:hypothetical protein